MENLNCINAWVIILGVAIFLAIILTAVVMIWLQLVKNKRLEKRHNTEAEYWRARIAHLKKIE